MALDEALLRAARTEARRRPLLRVYTWSRPTLSIGAHQRLSDELIDRCAGYGVDVVRRPTGGTAVLHGDDLTYCVVAQAGGRGVLDAYSWIAECLIAGLARMGIDAEVGGRGSRPAALTAGGACFASTVGADLQVGGAKICGSAQVRRSGWLLQHGSIPIGDPRPLTRDLLRHPGADRCTYVADLRPGTTAEQLAGSLVSGFEALWGPGSPVTENDFVPELARTSLPVQQMLA
jgi:lipoate-protein ligase A